MSGPYDENPYEFAGTPAEISLTYDQYTGVTYISLAPPVPPEVSGPGQNVVNNIGSITYDSKGRITGAAPLAYSPVSSTGAVFTGAVSGVPPSEPDDFTTKYYVDSAVQGIIQGAVRGIPSDIFATINDTFTQLSLATYGQGAGFVNNIAGFYLDSKGRVSSISTLNYTPTSPADVSTFVGQTIQSYATQRYVSTYVGSNTSTTKLTISGDTNEIAITQTNNNITIGLAEVGPTDALANVPDFFQHVDALKVDKFGRVTQVYTYNFMPLSLAEQTSTLSNYATNDSISSFSTSLGTTFATTGQINTINTALAGLPNIYATNASISSLSTNIRLHYATTNDLSSLSTGIYTNLSNYATNNSISSLSTSIDNVYMTKSSLNVFSTNIHEYISSKYQTIAATNDLTSTIQGTYVTLDTYNNFTTLTISQTGDYATNANLNLLSTNVGLTYATKASISSFSTSIYNYLSAYATNTSISSLSTNIGTKYATNASISSFSTNIYSRLSTYATNASISSLSTNIGNAYATNASISSFSTNIYSRLSTYATNASISSLSTSIGNAYATNAAISSFSTNIYNYLSNYATNTSISSFSTNLANTYATINSISSFSTNIYSRLSTYATNASISSLSTSVGLAYATNASISSLSTNIYNYLSNYQTVASTNVLTSTISSTYATYEYVSSLMRNVSSTYATLFQVSSLSNGISSTYATITSVSSLQGTLVNNYVANTTLSSYSNYVSSTYMPISSFGSFSTMAANTYATYQFVTDEVSSILGTSSIISKITGTANEINNVVSGAQSENNALSLANFGPGKNVYSNVQYIGIDFKGRVSSISSFGYTPISGLDASTITSTMLVGYATQAYANSVSTTVQASTNIVVDNTNPRVPCIALQISKDIDMHNSSIQNIYGINAADDLLITGQKDIGITAANGSIHLIGPVTATDSITSTRYVNTSNISAQVVSVSTLNVHRLYDSAGRTGFLNQTLMNLGNGAVYWSTMSGSGGGGGGSPDTWAAYPATNDIVTNSKNVKDKINSTGNSGYVLTATGGNGVEWKDVTTLISQPQATTYNAGTNISIDGTNKISLETTAVINMNNNIVMNNNSINSVNTITFNNNIPISVGNNSAINPFLDINGKIKVPRIVDANDSVGGDKQVLTINGGQMVWADVPAGAGDASTWSQYAATQKVDMSGNTISSIALVETSSIMTSQFVLHNGDLSTTFTINPSLSSIQTSANILLSNSFGDNVAALHFYNPIFNDTVSIEYSDDGYLVLPPTTKCGVVEADAIFGISTITNKIVIGDYSISEQGFMYIYNDTGNSNDYAMITYETDGNIVISKPIMPRGIMDAAGKVGGSGFLYSDNQGFLYWSTISGGGGGGGDASAWATYKANATVDMSNNTITNANVIRAKSLNVYDSFMEASITTYPSLSSIKMNANLLLSNSFGNREPKLSFYNSTINQAVSITYKDDGYLLLPSTTKCELLTVNKVLGHSTFANSIVVGDYNTNTKGLVFLHNDVGDVNDNALITYESTGSVFISKPIWPRGIMDSEGNFSTSGYLYSDNNGYLSWRIGGGGAPVDLGSWANYPASSNIDVNNCNIFGASIIAAESLHINNTNFSTTLTVNSGFSSIQTNANLLLSNSFGDNVPALQFYNPVFDDTVSIQYSDDGYLILPSTTKSDILNVNHLMVNSTITNNIVVGDYSQKEQGFIYIHNDIGNATDYAILTYESTGNIVATKPIQPRGITDAVGHFSTSGFLYSDSQGFLHWSTLTGSGGNATNGTDMLIINNSNISTVLTINNTLSSIQTNANLVLSNSFGDGIPSIYFHNSTFGSTVSIQLKNDGIFELPNYTHVDVLNVSELQVSTTFTNTMVIGDDSSSTQGILKLYNSKGDYMDCATITYDNTGLVFISEPIQPIRIADAVGHVSTSGFLYSDNQGFLYWSSISGGGGGGGDWATVAASQNVDIGGHNISNVNTIAFGADQSHTLSLHTTPNYLEFNNAVKIPNFYDAYNNTGQANKMLAIDTNANLAWMDIPSGGGSGDVTQSGTNTFTGTNTFQNTVFTCNIAKYNGTDNDYILMYKIKPDAIVDKNNGVGAKDQILRSDGTNIYWDTVSGTGTLTGITAGTNISVDNTNNPVPTVNLSITTDVDINNKNLTNIQGLHLSNSGYGTDGQVLVSRDDNGTKYVSWSNLPTSSGDVYTTSNNTFQAGYTNTFNGTTNINGSLTISSGAADGYFLKCGQNGVCSWAAVAQKSYKKLENNNINIYTSPSASITNTITDFSVNSGTKYKLEISITSQGFFANNYPTINDYINIKISTNFGDLDTFTANSYKIHVPTQETSSDPIYISATIIDTITSTGIGNPSIYTSFISNKTIYSSVNMFVNVIISEYS